MEIKRAKEKKLNKLKFTWLLIHHELYICWSSIIEVRTEVFLVLQYTQTIAFAYIEFKQTSLSLQVSYIFCHTMQGNRRLLLSCYFKVDMVEMAIRVQFFVIFTHHF